MSFEKRIKPLFRARDRQSMKFAVDLWSYGDVRQHADGIARCMRDGWMGCDGAWPLANIASFERWDAMKRGVGSSTWGTTDGAGEAAGLRGCATRMSAGTPGDPGSADRTREPTDAPVPINPALLTALTTEHFTLQGARAATISESSSRSALYISAVASSLVALGFVAQVSRVGDTFQAFAFTVLPTLFVLGLFTWVRLTENGVEDLQYLRAINRIRGYYLKIEPESATTS